jgi:hypothetical protein
MFDDVWTRPVHVIDPFEVPHSWHVDRAFDWGSSKPYSVGWFAEADGTIAHFRDGRRFAPPPGSIIHIAELYGWNGTPNTGTGETADEIAKQIVAAEEVMRLGILKQHPYVTPGPADSSIYDVEDGHCIADNMAAEDVYWTEANKAPGTRVNGWQLLRQMLKATLESKEEPRFYVVNSCTNFIRTVPMLPRSDKKPDDVNTNAEDHAADMVRYRLLAGSQQATESGTSGY